MVQNIAIVSFKSGQAYNVAKVLAGQLDMSFLDTVELFEFDNAPRTQSDMIREFGLRLYKKEIRSTVKYASFFENTVINVDISALYSNNILDIVKNNCLLIYLNNGTKRVYNFLKKQNYQTKELKKLYKLSLDQVEKRNRQIKDRADITLNVSAAHDHDLKIASEVIRHIKEFYGIR